MTQALDTEPWPPAIPHEEESPLSVERKLLIDRLHSADSEWARIQHEAGVSLGEKATAAVLLQEARVQLAGYNDFHPE